MILNGSCGVRQIFWARVLASLVLVLLWSTRSLDEATAGHEFFQVDAAFSETRMRLNERIWYTVIVSWTGDPEQHYLLSPEPPFFNFKVENVSYSSKRAVKDRQRVIERIYRFHLKPERIGRAGVRTFSISYYDHGLSVRKHIKVEESSVEIRSTPLWSFRKTILPIGVLLGATVLIFVKGRQKITYSHGSLPVDSRSADDHFPVDNCAGTNDGTNKLRDKIHNGQVLAYFIELETILTDYLA